MEKPESAPVINASQFFNNQVVNMRKDVKRVKILTTRKLIRHMSKLTSKKGPDDLIQKNKRRAQRILEEINSIKKLKPDFVTKTALQEDLNFEKICKQPNCNSEIRAIARLTMHPTLKQKITAMKAAVKAFQEARKSKVELEPKGEEVCQQPTTAVTCTGTEDKCKQGKTKQKQSTSKPEHTSVAKPACKTLHKDSNPITSREDPKASSEECEDPIASGEECEDPISSGEECEDPMASGEDPIASGEECEDPMASGEDPIASSEECEDDTLDFQKNSQAPALLEVPKASRERKPGNCVQDKKAAENQSKNKGNKLKKKTLSKHESESDIEDSDQEEKEYFDDSTEERFHKQCSDFDDSDSDSDGDFFIGKVSQTKRKKSSKNGSEDKVKKEKPPKEPTKSSEHSETQKAIPTPKTVKLESVFCSSLSGTMQKPSFMKRENKPLPVRNKQAVVPQVNKFAKKPQFDRSTMAKSQSQSQRKPEVALHPSWEASKKRKEQSQIAKFQGKKIVFDD